MCGLREHLMSLDHVSHSCESHNQSALQVIVPSDIKSFTWLGDRALFPGGADTTCPPGYAPSYLQGGAPGLWPDPCYPPRPPPAPALLLLFAWLGSRRSPALLSGLSALRGHSSPALLGHPGLSPPPGHGACITDLLPAPGACLPGGSALSKAVP